MDLTTRDIKKLSGASARQLQWWDEQGLVRPDVIKGRRVYSPHAASMARLVLALRDRNISLKNIASIIRQRGRQIYEASSQDQTFLVIFGIKFEGRKRLQARVITGTEALLTFLTTVTGPSHTVYLSRDVDGNPRPEACSQATMPFYYEASQIHKQGARHV